MPVQGLQRCVRSHLQRFDTVRGIVHRARWTREMKHVVDLATFDGEAHILLEKFKAGIVSEMFKVRQPSGKEVVDGDDSITVGQ